MSSLIKKSDLAEPERQLVELLQVVGFGRIEKLRVSGGKPAFDPPPRAIASLKMDAETYTPDEVPVRDFALKQSVVRLLVLIRRIGHGEILVIHVRHGLPLDVEIDRPVVQARNIADCSS